MKGSVQAKLRRLWGKRPGGGPGEANMDGDVWGSAHGQLGVMALPATEVAATEKKKKEEEGAPILTERLIQVRGSGHVIALLQPAVSFCQ